MTLLLPATTQGDNPADPMRRQLVLSLFTGAGLLDRAFEALGAVVVSAGDILHGKDIRDFHARPGMFDGVIGGPPCQVFSNAAQTGTSAINLIPEYLRIVEEAKPQWAVMENVTLAAVAAPDWPVSIIEDFNCGGFTSRIRGFWFYGLPAAPAPAFRAGKREYSVLATSWKDRTGTKGKHKTYPQRKPWEAAYLQGYSGLHHRIMKAQPTPSGLDGLTERARGVLAIHMLGNGVPAAMANYVAGHVAYYLRNGVTSAPVQVPMFQVVA